MTPSTLSAAYVSASRLRVERVLGARAGLCGREGGRVGGVHHRAAGEQQPADVDRQHEHREDGDQREHHDHDDRARFLTGALACVADASDQTGSHRNVPSIVGSSAIDGSSGMSIVRISWMFAGSAAVVDRHGDRLVDRRAGARLGAPAAAHRDAAEPGGQGPGRGADDGVGDLRRVPPDRGDASALTGRGPQALELPERQAVLHHAEHEHREQARRSGRTRPPPHRLRGASSNGSSVDLSWGLAPHSSAGPSLVRARHRVPDERAAGGNRPLVRWC